MLVKVDYIKKGQLLVKGLPKLVAQKSFLEYKLFIDKEEHILMHYKTKKNTFSSFICPVRENLAEINSKLVDVSESDIIECHRINRAKYAKNSRLNSALRKMIQVAQVCGKDLLFLTLTFNDASLKLKSNVRRKYVTRFLNNNSLLYVGNIDFGEEYGREHYHAVCVGSVDLKEWHIYGAIKVQHIRITKYCGKVLAKYIVKLTNHALKECALTNSNKRNCLLYKRCFENCYIKLLQIYDIEPIQEDLTGIF